MHRASPYDPGADAESAVSGGLGVSLRRAIIDGDDPATIARVRANNSVTRAMVRLRAKWLSAHPAVKLAKRLQLRLRCRDWLLEQYARLEAEQSILEEADDTLSAELFRQRYYRTNRPVVLRGVATSWKAVHAWTQDYLSRACGEAQVRVMMNRDRATVADTLAGGRLERTMRLADFLSLVEQCGPSNDLYLVAKNRFFDSADVVAIAEDIGPSTIVETDPRRAEVMLWLGPSGTHTPLHYDSRSSLLFQIRGRKSVTLVPPWFASAMQQTEEWYANVDLAALDRSRVLTATTVIAPGDALFLPVGWWHDVTALGTSISLTCTEFCG